MLVIMQAIFWYVGFIGIDWQGIDKNLFFSTKATINYFRQFFTSVLTLDLAILGGFLGCIYKEKRKFVIWAVLVILIIYILILIGWNFFWRVLVGKITEI